MMPEPRSDATAIPVNTQMEQSMKGTPLPLNGKVLDEPSVRALSAGLRGRLLHPGDDGYDTARTVWNAMTDNRPAVIARCAGAADVIHCVRFAREHDLLVSVRGGGHNVAGNAVCEG